jgi:ribokinase
MIVVAGSINADLVARVAHLPREGETQIARRYDVHGGGKGANQALAARRSGAEVALIGAVGRDGFAEVALASLREAGVDLAGVAALDAPTGVALIHVDAHGRNTITVVPGANQSFHAAMLADRILDGRTTLVLQLEIPLAEATRVAQRASARRSRVMLNAAPPMALSADLLDAVDVLIVNEHEAVVVAEAASVAPDPVAFCVAMADRHALAAVVTLGADGLVATDARNRYRMPAARVDVVDTTAAGDAFVGALAASLDRGDALADALAEGAAAGSHACTAAGAQPSIGLRERWRAMASDLRGRMTVESRR